MSKSSELSLDETIAQAREEGLKMLLDKSSYQNGYRQLQISRWLEELRDLRKKYNSSESRIFGEI